MKKVKKEQEILQPRKNIQLLFFPQKIVFTGEICSQENQKDSCVGGKEMRIEVILPLYFFTLLFSQKKKKKDTLMDHDQKCMYVCFCVFNKFYCRKLNKINS